MIAVLNLTILYPKVKKYNRLNKAIRELTAESDTIGERIRALGIEAEDLATGIRTSSHDFVKNDKLILNEMRIS